MKPDAVSTLLSHFTFDWGPEFVAHLLACDASEVDNLTLTPERVNVIAKLHNLISGEGVGAAFSPHRALSVAHRLVRYDPNLQCTPASSYYVSCGGTMPSFNGDDATESSLLRLAADAAFPALLLEESEGGITSRQVLAMAAISSHPAKADFVRSLRNRSEPLRSLFEGRLPADESEWKYESVTDVDTYLTWSDGSVGYVTVGQLSTSILLSTSTTMTDAGLLSSYLTAVKQSLAVARTMASFRSSRTIAHVALSGVSLSSEVDTVKFASGKLRRSTPIDTLPHRNNGEKWRGIDPDLAILEIGVDLQLEVATGTRWKEQVFESPQLGSKMDLSRLALLFSSDSDTLISPIKMFAYVNLPISSGGFYTTNPYRWPYHARNLFTIDTDTATRIEHWSRLLEQLPNNLFLGMRRLLSAATSRIDPLDRLVDAVIAWENLFGTASGESTFRVCGAMALVLEPEDVSKRNSLFLELKKLYGIRSRVVHGAKEPDKTEAERSADRAVRLAVESYRTVCLRHDLLRAKDSSTRSMALMLDL